MNGLQNSQLSNLAAEINAEHRRCEEAMRASLTHALRTGELLIQAKALVSHGDWLPWIATNCEFSDRTARAYMHVARNWPGLAKTATVANLTYREALQLLATTGGREQGEQAPEGVNTVRVPTDFAEAKAALEDLRRRIDAATTLDEIMPLVQEARETSFIHTTRWIKQTWEFGVILNALDRGGEPVSERELKAMGCPPGDATQARRLAEIPEETLAEYFVYADHRMQRYGDELTIKRLLMDCVYSDNWVRNGG